MVGPPDSEMIPIEKIAGYSQAWEEGICHTVGPHGEVPEWTRRQRERANAGERLYVYLQEAEWAGLGLPSLNNSSELWGPSLSDTCSGVSPTEEGLGYGLLTG